MPQDTFQATVYHAKYALKKGWCPLVTFESHPFQTGHLILKGGIFIAITGMYGDCICHD